MNADGKVCTRCGVLKPLRQYPPKPARSDGRQSWCRQCYAEYQRQVRAQDPYKQLYDARQRRAYAEASRRLREAHREEFDALLTEAMHLRGIGERLAAS